MLGTTNESQGGAAGLLAPEDVAALLRTTVRQVGHLRHRGQIVAPVKIPGLGYRWRADAFFQWLDERTKS